MCGGCHVLSHFSLSCLNDTLLSLPFKEKHFSEIETYLKRKHEGIQSIQAVDKEDLETVSSQLWCVVHSISRKALTDKASFTAQKINHLTGLRKKCMRVNFWTVKDLLEVRQSIVKDIEKNKRRKGIATTYDDSQLNMYTSHYCIV